MSESSKQSPDAQGDNSASASPPPPPPPPVPCDPKSKAPAHAEKLNEEPPKQKPRMNATGGHTDYETFPKPEWDVFCDGKDEKWVVRLTESKFQQSEAITEHPEVITNARIADPKVKCSSLKLWGEGIYQAFTVAQPGSIYIPFNVIKVHEDVHVKITSENVAAEYELLKAALSNLSEPCKTDGRSLSKAGAKELLRANVDKAIKAFNDGLKKRDKVDVHTTKKQDFIDAQSIPAKTWYEKISARMKELKCEETLQDPPK